MHYYVGIKVKQCNLTSVPAEISCRIMSPVPTTTALKSLAKRLHIVPLPPPGGPMITKREAYRAV